MKKHIFFYLFLPFLWLYSCNVIFEDNLSKKKVEVLTPPDGYISNIQTQEFIWEKMVEADSYRVQIVKDSFEYITSFALDTIVNATRVSATLLPGRYEWRVIALNTAGESDWDEFFLTIQEDTTLVGQIVNTLSPLQNEVYTRDSVSFFWDALLYAQSYQLQVATGPSFNSQLIREDISTPNDYHYSINTLGTGVFYYRIRAMRNNIDTTVWSAAKQFSVNAAPVLLSPNNASNVTLPQSLLWQSASNVVSDSLYLYYAAEGTPYKRVALTAGTNAYFFTTTDTVGKGAGSYYWELRSLSNTGYLSSYSGLRQFIIN